MTSERFFSRVKHDIFRPFTGRHRGIAFEVTVDLYDRLLVPRHSDYDWLILSQSRMGKSSGGTRIWMLLATPG
jgi:hypothetical protein